MRKRNMPWDFKFRGTQFSYDVNDLADHIADADGLPNIVDALQTSSIFNRVTVLDGIKKSQYMPDIGLDTPLQEITGCTLTPSGTTKFSDKELTVVPVGTSEAYCNEDLVGKWTEELLRKGLVGQNEIPVPEDVIRALHLRNFRRKAERLWWLGDEDSTDAELNMANGVFAQVWSDAEVTTIPYEDITPDNAWQVFSDLAGAIPAEALAEGATYEVRTSRANASALLQAIWNDKDYNALVQGVTLTDATLDFVMPVTGIRIVSDINLGNEHLIALPLQTVFLGTDSESDKEYVDSFYVREKDHVVVEVKARIGAGYVKPEWIVVMEEGGDDDNDGE